MAMRSLLGCCGNGASCLGVCGGNGALGNANVM